jgi:hypothetical protein
MIDESNSNNSRTSYSLSINTTADFNSISVDNQDSSDAFTPLFSTSSMMRLNRENDDSFMFKIEEIDTVKNRSGVENEFSDLAFNSNYTGCKDKDSQHNAPMLTDETSTPLCKQNNESSYILNASLVSTGYFLSLIFYPNKASIMHFQFFNFFLKHHLISHC